MDSRLRVGRAIGKNEEEVAAILMAQLKDRGNPESPPAMATDGRGGYREAMVETWGQMPEYSGRGQRPTQKQPQPDWHYHQVVKHRSGRHLIEVSIKVIYGTPEEVKALPGKHTAYVERTHLTSRQMNGRLVRKTLSFSKDVEMLKAVCAWEDWIYNLTRSVRTLRIEIKDGKKRWQPCSPAMAAGLTNHFWTVKELLMRDVTPNVINSN